MSELIIELFSEEIPARMQEKAAEDFRRIMTNAIVEKGLSYYHAAAYSTPRRLVLIVDEIPAQSQTQRIERKGPKLDAPQPAIDGFLRSTGLTIADLEIRDVKGVQTYFAISQNPGRAAQEIISEALEECISNFPWPKSMRWGSRKMRWVRPLQNILALWVENDAPSVLPLEIEGIKANDLSFGHRFMAPGSFSVQNAEDYRQKLREHFVILNAADRKEQILNAARNQAFAQGLDLIENDKLAQENAGLTEYPVVYTGKIDEDFLKLPPEVLQTSMAEHQKFLSLLNPQSGQVEGYVIVANRSTADQGATIKAGNAKVLNARLADAKFFWDSDLYQSRNFGLEPWVEKLSNVTFHNKIGSQKERIFRIKDIAKAIAPLVNAQADDAKTAAYICKADLQSAMVFEFPELQGKMGRLYAEEAGYSPEIAAVCEEHYAPLGPKDAVPQAPLSIAVALADKIDLLTNFWAIDEKPTGSKDPFALRRAALGMIRIILENHLALDLRALLALGNSQADPDNLLGFFFDRLTVYLRDQGLSHDVLRAVIQEEGTVNLYDILQKSEALQRFLKGDEGENLKAGVKRALSILQSEEQKDGVSYELDISAELLVEAAESELAHALDEAQIAVHQNLTENDYHAALYAIGNLRNAIDAFFADVVVNDEDDKLRRNRLCLLNRIRALTLTIANFAQLEG